MSDLPGTLGLFILGAYVPFFAVMFALRSLVRVLR